jgi:hypothetical protein
VQEPEDVSAGNGCAGIHLRRAPAWCDDDSVRQHGRSSRGVIAASAVHDDNFEATGEIPEAPEKTVDQSRLV